MACKRGKAIRGGHTGGPQPPHPERGAHWHGDLAGPFRIPSYQGAQYFAVIIDDRTRFRWILCLNAKGDFAEDFKNLVEKEILHQRHSLKIFQTDGGTEFVTKTLAHYLETRGCHLKLTAAGTPEQNPVAERSVRTIKEGVRTMLIDADLDEAFWQDAAQYFVEILNVTANKKTKPIGQTPYEAYKRIRPNLERFHKFGAPCVFKDHTKQRGAFEAPGRIGRFLGHARHKRAYKVLDIESRSVYYPTEIDLKVSNVRQPEDLRFKDTERWDQLSDDDFTPEDMEVLERRVGARPSAGGREMRSSVGAETGPRERTINPPPRKTRSDKGKKRKRTAGATEHTACVRQAIAKIRDATAARCYDVYPSFGEHDMPYQAEEVAMIMEAATHDRAMRASVSKHLPDVDASKQILETIAKITNVNPKTLQEARSRKDWAQWWNAIKYEYGALISNGTWTILEVPNDTKLIRTKWVFVIKRDKNGNIEKYRARLVAKGFTQVMGLNYGEFEQYAPVASYGTVRLLLALGNLFNFEMEQLDVDSAYLKGRINTDVFVEIPEGLAEYLQEMKSGLPEAADKAASKMAMKLNKTLYGLKQSGRLWNDTFAEEIKKHGYQRLRADQSVFIKRIKGKLIILALYVDDILLLGEDQHVMNIAKRELMGMFEMKEQGQVEWLLGMRVDRDRRAGKIWLTQSTYVDQILEENNLCHVKPVSTPMVYEGKEVKTEDESTKMPFNYRKVVGQLLYLSTATRPDIAVAVSKLASEVASPTPRDHARVKRVLRYLKGTKNMGVVYTATHEERMRAGITLDAAEIRDCIRMYVDASYGDCLKTRKSRSGVILECCGGPVLWVSKKQNCVAVSTTEAEYIAAAMGAKMLVATRQMLREIGMSSEKEVILYEDNEACIAIANNPDSSSRTKHIDIRFHYLREQVQNKILELISCPTTSMKADLLTKPLRKDIFTRMREAINVFW